MDPQISDRKEGTLRETVAVANIGREAEEYSWKSRDVGPAVEDSVFDAGNRLGKIRGAKGARNAMVEECVSSRGRKTVLVQPIFLYRNCFFLLRYRRPRRGRRRRKKSVIICE